MDAPTEPPTRQERAAESLTRPLQILARTLYECDAFWDHALAIRQSPRPLSLARQRARLYVPKRGNHGEQDVLVALLLVVAEHLRERYSWRGGPGIALKRLLEVGAPVAWITDDPLEAGRLYGLAEPGARNRTPGLSGRKVSEAGIAGLQRGAEVVRKRGASVCLAEGCDAELVELRVPTLRPGSRKTTERRSFCNRHEVEPDYSLLEKLGQVKGLQEIEKRCRRPLLEALDAARAVLVPAGYAYRSLSHSYSSASVRWSEERPKIAQVDHQTIFRRLATSEEPARSPSVVTRIKADLQDLSEWYSERDLVLERGLLAEAA